MLLLLPASGVLFGGDPSLPQFLTLAEVQRIFGVSRAKARQWVARQLFRSIEAQVLVPVAEVRRFARDHADEYSLARVDQRAFSGLVFHQVARGQSKSRSL